ncbi:VanZ family protein [Gracilibacillus sp. YIM 98692]|uniref:VanZ family protein n=1 Tax=Gracilibacillus sp. YIM 98692 TaxID=2663532 RepID=UPI0013D2F443|nr:VanZ family protein [Gracilibacillus sp. YIM 98692]
MYKIISWMLVVVWMVFIFYLSHQPAVDSNQLSTNVTEEIIEKVEKVRQDNNWNIPEMNHIVRKYAHFLVYFVLGILVMHAYNSSGFSKRKATVAAFITCLGYAISDEFHQRFIDGRGSQVMDVIIDSGGAIIGIIVWFFLYKIIKRSGRIPD